MEKILLIFDFDGTIADTRLLYFTEINKIAKLYGAKPLSKDEFDTAMAGDYWNVLKEKLPWWKLPIFLFHVKFIVGRKNPKAFVGFKDFIENIDKNKYMIGILTANSKQNVMRLIKQEGIDTNLFSFIYASRNKTKSFSKIKKIYKCFKYIAIGDEHRDLTAAIKNNIIPIGVSWGFHNKQKLKDAGAKHIIDDFNDILKI